MNHPARNLKGHAAAVNAVTPAFGVKSPLTSGGWRAEPIGIERPDEVAKALVGHGATISEGWLQCQCKLIIVRRPADVPSDDPILEGELLLDDGSSVLLRPDGRGQVRMVRQQEVDVDTDGALAVLWTETEHYATPAAMAKQVETLHYRVYFEIDPDRGALPCGYRFLGFGWKSGERP